MNKAGETLRHTLFRNSVVHAFQQVPGYERLYAGIPWDDSDIPGSLLRLPTVRKGIVAANLPAFLNPNLRTDFVQNTSGSTGPCFFLHRSACEQQAHEQFFGAIDDSSAADGHPARDFVALRLSAQDHGTLFRIPTTMRGFDQAVMNASTLLNTVHFLRASNDPDDPVPLITCMQGSLKSIAILTTYLNRTGIDLPHIKLAFIVTIGDYLTQSKRRLIEDRWGCPVYSRYSLSEMVGGALGRPGDPFDTFSFDHYACPELVEIDQPHIAADDIGELLMTSPYPFVQRQPLIRYHTNDLFKRLPVKEGEAARYQYLGRRNQSLVTSMSEGMRVMLPSVAIIEALEDIPGLGGQYWCGYLGDAYQTEGLCYHKFQGRFSRRGHRLSVELTLERTDRGDADSTAAEIRRRVLANTFQLGCDVDAIMLSVRFADHLEQSHLYDLTRSLWTEE